MTDSIAFDSNGDELLETRKASGALVGTSWNQSLTMHPHFPGVPGQPVHSAPPLGGLLLEQSSEICSCVP